MISQKYNAFSWVNSEKRQPLLKNRLKEIYEESPVCPILVLDIKNKIILNLQWAF